MNHRQVIIFDTTLRDGEQAPGASLYPEEKVRIAKQLARLGVDVIEPGFPAASPGEFAAVQQISREVEDVEICGFARAVESDIDAAVRATRDAAKRRLHLFISSSQIHLDFQLRKTQKQVLQIARDMVAYAKQFVDVIEFSPMDATRTGMEFLLEMVEAVIAEGATIINLPDTVGYALPEEYGAMFARVRKEVRGADRILLSAHCHNDLGLAVANTLAALQNGADQAEVTVNGIGERTGNCALEELVMVIATRQEALGLVTGIRQEEIYRTSRLVSQLTRSPIAYNKPVVGRNAFQHESGIHQDGLLKHRATYEIMDPERLGVPRHMIVLGKHSGRHALKHRIAQFGVTLADEELDALFRRFKVVADEKKHVSDDDLLALMDAKGHEPAPLALVELQVLSGTQRARLASVTLRHQASGRERTYTATGAGPIEAVIRAIKQAVPLSVEFADLELHSLGAGEEASGEAAVTITVDGQSYRGVGIHADVVLAVAQAFLSACNQAMAVHDEAAEKRNERMA
ncbi:2-isopropylmalate synthase [Alicyclobacillus cellulosilyticus]|uniref:2-isopropylmalate synthase n=1 Tax=Alicyclobacillus cellulosilyticus TaxID=1003997 RepID=A0A917NKD7_9BACL|nr:2-isopropylmalate synthase [Alicyclobacillus cellulosilyticus]GGJ07224.1 2-isopropylmalate synthase [Alicyclobacillus cellulosilyticus]